MRLIGIALIICTSVLILFVGAILAVYTAAAIMERKGKEE